jgi:hypothetical protein
MARPHKGREYKCSECGKIKGTKGGIPYHYVCPPCKTKRRERAAKRAGLKFKR